MNDLYFTRYRTVLLKGKKKKITVYGKENVYYIKNLRKMTYSTKDLIQKR